MRISDWSSDVCSTDLACHRIDGVEVAGASAPSHDIGGDRDGEVGLACPRAADQHDIAASRADRAILKGPDHLLIERCAVGDETLQILPTSPPRNTPPISQRGPPPVQRHKSANAANEHPKTMGWLEAGYDNT